MLLLSFSTTLLLLLGGLTAINFLYPNALASIERGTVFGTVLLLWFALLVQAMVIWFIYWIQRRKLLRLLKEEHRLLASEREFVSLAAHQLRTPLSALKWSVDLLKKGEVGSLTEEQLSFIAKIESTNNHLITLVNDLLNTSRIEEQRMAFQYTATDPAKKTEEVIDLMKQSYHEKSLRITGTFPRDAIAMTTDPTKLEMVLSNILDNACKYTPREGTVAVEMSAQGKSVRWKIKDSGMGIPRNQQKRLFEKFFRADNAVKAQTIGTGLGLYLAKKIVEHDGGTLTITSTEGKGTEVIISLPLTPNT